jgi:hypothetical protein
LDIGGGKKPVTPARAEMGEMNSAIDVRIECRSRLPQ